MRTIPVAIALLAAASLASAQPVTETAPGSAPEPAAVAFVTGLSAGGSETGPVFGAVVSKGLTSRLTIEGQAAWLGRGSGVTGMTAFGSLLANLVDPANRVVPFVAVGGGVYHTSFDMGRPGMFGRYGWMEGPGMMGGGAWYGPGAMSGTGPLPWPDHVPQFYARRMGDITPPADGRWETRSFTDPMLSLGGGARIDLGRRFFLRPDARALVVLGDGETSTVGVFNLGIGIRF